ncbi:class II fumarate hydratase [Geobacillus stearothermophilus]|uniref:class II fumarate hydratase n=1 Tax=Geobacillus stearothermophilus TaxID=1422 RepID=UPI000518C4DE|nr:class II fumarate hydratase [Geobacillus stearothermophilus]KOR94667.1 fumarate hydratase [Geobacillus stearothermophilus ATCC 12980]MED3731808.1 class II fumarate hydratase [Geobacillus stearothermophilus]MED3734947.1 class II fumarate hydratase [Geobacillus stearothermophilus]MED3741161.1 class II fumarate hydratase [Geobacillus stearothermophilus]MED3751431.1 class II fumarate hydratase [Geobacillus stearothermophilus]
MNVRIERDSLGEVQVPADKYWGAQTERSRQNFRIGKETMPLELIYAYAELKKAAAIVNHQAGKLSEAKQRAIVATCEEILAGRWDDHFPLVVWQTGSGTQTNMNVNEVVARRASELLGDGEGRIHPNDDVNMSQSSNDTFPTVMHIAIYMKIQTHLLPALDGLIGTFAAKERQYEKTIKIGRTHLQDATPLTFGQEISGWRTMLEKSKAMITEASEKLLDLAIGGTAVGTGINAPPGFGEQVAEQLKAQTVYPFRSATNKFHALTSHDEIVYVHGTLKALASDLMKIANDIRWLASGPRSGLGEITIPANEPGSSIMPGKVNPTQSEAMTMVAVQVFGNDATIGFAASQGNFQLNVFKPVIAYNAIQSVQLLGDAIRSFDERCAKGLEANEAKMKEYVERSLMLVTALSPHIGYDRAAEIAKLAHREGLTLKEAALKTGYVTAEQYEEWVRPEKMI